MLYIPKGGGDVEKLWERQEEKKKKNWQWLLKSSLLYGEKYE